MKALARFEIRGDMAFWTPIESFGMYSKCRGGHPSREKAINLFNTSLKREPRRRLGRQSTIRSITNEAYYIDD
jgi:hypothetical protein